ncbi:MAG: FHA domain-containing protein, partial [Thermoguttaceae bacterium]
MERLLVKNADLSTKTFTLESNVVVIGRQPYCDVVLTNGAVSREHAKLTKTSRGWVIEDLQSRNGVWVNGRRIGDRRLLLSNKDLIQLGEASLIFLSDSESAVRLSGSDVRFPLQEGEFNEKSIVSQVFLNGSGSSLLVGSGKGRFDSPEEYNREIALLEERLRVMFDLARILGKAEDVVDLVPRLLTNLLRLFPKADSACVAAPDSNENSSENASWKLVSFKRRDETNAEPFHASRAIMRYVVSKRSAILSESAL